MTTRTGSVAVLLGTLIIVVLACQSSGGDPDQIAPPADTPGPTEPILGPEGDAPSVTPPPPVTPTPESQSRRTSTSAASCVELYSTETLRDRAIAFDGTVESVETRVDPKLPTEGSQSQELPWITFKMNQWFKGGESPEVEIWVDPHSPEGVWPLEPGDRLLVAGEYRWGQPPEDPFAWGCGFTQPYTPEAAAQWADVMGDEPGPVGAPAGLSRLVDELRAAGLEVEPAGFTSQQFFSVDARMFTVNEETIQVFEYTDETTAQKEAARVSPDGYNFSDEKRTFMDVDWIDTPHFLRDGRIIVLYVGNEPTVLDALHSVLGPQFADGRSEPLATPTIGDEVVPEEVPAPIDDVQVGMTRSIPPGVYLAVRSGLPNGCVEFGAYDVAVDGFQVDVTMTNIQPKNEDLMCTMDYRTADSRISLGSEFEPGSTYVVVVNGVTHATFDTPDGPPARSGQDTPQDIERPFQLRPGETAAIGSEGLVIEFVEVLGDSRCPSDVTCIWEGRATILVGVSLDGEGLGEHELALAGGQGVPAVVSAGSYMIGLVALDPYPEAAAGDSEPDYVVTLAVSKAGKGGPADLAPVELTVRAEPVPGEPLIVLFVADLSGGADNDRDLYCQGWEWQFGDGKAVAIMPGCIVWSPSVTIPRHFGEVYTYEGAGTFEASFTYGPLGPVAATVEVR